MIHSDVLIIGAGPTGLVLALWLTKLGVKVRIVDKTAEPGTTSRALAVHARTLELYRQLDLADFVVEHGHKVPAVNLWVKGEPAARLPFATVGEDLTAYPFLQIFPQDRHRVAFTRSCRRFSACFCFRRCRSRRPIRRSIACSRRRSARTGSPTAAQSSLKQ
jgi:2-polyprenyl-6-methoxyphenol hydroxylase-like FAD-dependent oxidoreductase